MSAILALYGEAWKTRLAAGLGISSSQFFEWRRGTPKTARRDIDGELIETSDERVGNLSWFDEYADLLQGARLRRVRRQPFWLLFPAIRAKDE